MALISSSGLKKMVVLLFCVAMSITCFRMAQADGGEAQAYEAVLDRSGTEVRYGDILTVWNVDTGIGYLRYFFGLGYTGDVVLTDVELIAGLSASGVLYCQHDGQVVTVPVDSSGTPEQSLIRVRYNATDGFYRLQITQEDPPVYVQFVLISQGTRLCTRGAEGSRLRFQITSTTSTAHDLYNTDEGPGADKLALDAHHIGPETPYVVMPTD